MLQWGGGPHRFRRKIFEFTPDWAALREENAPPDCTMQAPEMTSSKVPIKYGLQRCHISCASCMAGSEKPTDCTTCSEEFPHHTLLNPRFGTGTCSEMQCPLCKPRECCDDGHRHFIIDAESRNGVCLKHSDDCKAHCVSNSKFYVEGLGDVVTKDVQVCTKGCNEIVKLVGNILPPLPGSQRNIQLFDLVVCQSAKLVSCTGSN